MITKLKNRAEKFLQGSLPAAWLCFSVILVVYILTVSRTVPPYRDSGELITAAATLSIAHSPGYPLYMILGKAAVETGSLLGLNPALSMNLLSALCGAFASFFIFLFIYELTSSRTGAAFGSLAAGFAYMNWYLSVVAEMYSLNLLLVSSLLLLAVKKKYMAASFVAALTLGNHLTALFAMLPVAFYALAKDRKKINIARAAGFFGLGISVYLYHLLRAYSGPYINWGDPSSIQSLVRVVTRAAYGHTLDLVSRQVTLGQVFLPHLRRFFVHLYRDMSPFVLLFSVAGIITGFKKKGRLKDYSVVLLFIFILTGPFFLYMARMPINPHASAIVEVGYMIPEMVLAVFGGIFIAVLMGETGKKGFRVGIIAVSCLILLNTVSLNFDKADHSSNFFARDYALNILHSLEEGAFVLMRRDHPLFSLWYMRDMENIRPDVKVVALGLASASWYREKLRRDFPRALFPRQYRSDTQYVNELVSINKDKYPLYMTDAAAAELEERFHHRHQLKPWGLVYRVYLRGEEEFYDPNRVLDMMENEYKYTGEFNYRAHYDYFTRDFISLYAAAFNRLGGEFYRMGDVQKARDLYRRAVDMYPLLWRGWQNLAYSHFQLGELSEAARYYNIAIESAVEYMNMYTRREFFKPSIAGLFNSLGALYERKYRRDRQEEYFNEALENYDKALELQPDFSGAYFNRGVLYWARGDWEKVVENFRMALHYDPDNAEIERYLGQAERNLQ